MPVLQPALKLEQREPNTYPSRHSDEKAMVRVQDRTVQTMELI
nr:MAG TPA: hypothetical protein [Caudoviricetes sp.]